VLYGNAGRFIANNSNVYVPQAQLAEITPLPHAHAHARASHTSVLSFCADADACREVSSA